MHSTVARTARSVALLLIAVTGAQAQSLSFTGSRAATDIPAGATDLARCGAAPRVLLSGIAGIGTSSLGAFTTGESYCLNPPAAGQLHDGRWRFTFADASTHFGTATGTVTLPPVGGQAPVSLLFAVLGGTGQYASVAAGSLAVDGTIQFNPGGTTNSSVVIAGTITAVPEPGTKALVAAGLAAVGAGAAARRRRAA